MCDGTGNVWFTFDGQYLGNHRSDDLDELERCEDCDGTGISEECDRCLDARADEEDRAYDAERETDPYEAAGESPFGLPGGGKSL